MENKDLIKEIMSALKEELDEFKSELKAEIKDEMDNIRSTLEEEMESMEDREPPSPKSFFPHHVFNQFDDIDEDIDDIDEVVDAVDEEIRKKFDIDNNRESQEFDYIDFNKIHISGVFDVRITQSDSYKISIIAKDRFFKNLDISKEGETLHLRHSRHIGWRMSLIRPRVEIALPLLKELRLSGATRVRVSGFNTLETFKLHMDGASQLEAEITCGGADFEVSGASRARLIGSTKDAVIKVSGANRMDLYEFTIDNAAVKMSGASRLTANINGRLDARLSGASHFGWRGEPIMGDIRTSGAARLSKE